MSAVACFRQSSGKIICPLATSPCDLFQTSFARSINTTRLSSITVCILFNCFVLIGQVASSKRAVVFVDLRRAMGNRRLPSSLFSGRWLPTSGASKMLPLCGVYFDLGSRPPLLRREDFGFNAWSVPEYDRDTDRSCWSPLSGFMQRSRHHWLRSCASQPLA